MEVQEECFLDSCLDNLLDASPGDLEVKELLNDIDDQIKANTLSVEQCLQKLQEEINESCTSKWLQNTADCLQWLNNSSFSLLKPSSTPHGQMIEFLTALQCLLKNEQNQEEMILQFLLDLSSQCGVAFPSSPSGTSFHFASCSSLHVIDDDLAMDVKSTWDDVRLHLRRFLVDRLQSSLVLANDQPRIQSRTQCLQYFLFLYPESEVLTKYQNIQSKFVMDLLNSRVLAGSGETNFDKVVDGYKCSVPTLCSMIKEDLLILSGIVDTPLVLKFINETFLETITEEMTTHLERLCEQSFNENTLHAITASKNKQKGTVHVLATYNQTKKERNFCFTLHQLQCLSQLIKLNLWLEERIEELSAEMLLLPSVTELNKYVQGKDRNFQGILKRNDENLLMQESLANETSVLLESSRWTKEVTILKFDWRKAFTDLSFSLAHCITVAVEEFSARILQNEHTEQSSVVGFRMSLVNTQKMRECFGALHEKEQPKQIAKFCSDLMEELDTLLPLALACKDDFLQLIRANFAEACCKVATAVLARLQERIRGVPAEAPVQNMYAVLSTAIYVLQHFTHYDNLMRGTSKMPLSLLPVQQYQEFISFLQCQVTNYSIRVCTTSILQDAESHHWDDCKAFYEGERCSFSVQMWHYFCYALRHDLWSVLPPKLAQEILTEVLEKSLALLASRYSQASPSYKRTSQIRTDVTAILLCVENLLWSVCSSVQEVLNPLWDSDTRIFKIHNHCNNLLIVLTILTAPLKSIYETFQNDCGDLPSDCLEQSINEPLHWLQCLKPSAIPTLIKTPSTGELAMQGQLKLLLAQPCCNWNLLLGTLLHHDCLIARFLLSCSKNKLPKCEDQVCFSEGVHGKDSSLTEAIFTVLSYCTLAPQSLGSVLERYMDEVQLWEYLCNMKVTTCSELEPEVIGLLKRTLVNSVKGIVNEIISVIHLWEMTENSGSYPHKQVIPESLLKAIPKEWNYTPKEMKRKESGKSLTSFAAQAVSLVITKLPAVIADFSPSIKYFFLLSEQNLPENFLEWKEVGLLVWYLIIIICQILEDGNSIEFLTGTTLDRWRKENLSRVRVCLESMLGKQKSNPNQATQIIIQSIEQQRPKWIENQLRRARKLSMDGAFVIEEGGVTLPERDSVLELTEQKINMMVLDICHKPGGSEYLRQIYHIIQLNEEHLNEFIVSQVSSDKKITPNRPLKLTLTSMDEQHYIFNPFEVYSLQSTSLLNQSAITEWNWDWSKLLLSYRGLNQTTFKVLLAHRHFKEVLVSAFMSVIFSN
ncbi:uncharacterized protein KIAA0825 homolog isoform X2 [Rhinatrema bivittatum]|uniref:uncharacterized protein KIAA0825 homolog isoform X2 n=1 Tax=Rhinatrema bivittatum TaxID=194408 RepID=UPI0011268134|nr:uncharacterized protein KIAA0825 homolog isoform X2 [Rhinatrema bivittatum]